MKIARYARRRTDIADQRVRDIGDPALPDDYPLKRNHRRWTNVLMLISSPPTRVSGDHMKIKRSSIEGILDTKICCRLCAAMPKPSAWTKLRTAVVVPESKRADRMLKEFRSQRYHILSLMMSLAAFPAR